MNTFFSACLAIRRTLQDGHDQWQLENGVHQVLLALANSKPDLFLTALFGQLQRGNPLGIAPRGWLRRSSRF